MTRMTRSFVAVVVALVAGGAIIAHAAEGTGTGNGSPGGDHDGSGGPNPVWEGLPNRTRPIPPGAIIGPPPGYVGPSRIYVAPAYVAPAPGPVYVAPPPAGVPSAALGALDQDFDRCIAEHVDRVADYVASDPAFQAPHFAESVRRLHAAAALIRTPGRPRAEKARVLAVARTTFQSAARVAAPIAARADPRAAQDLVGKAAEVVRSLQRSEAALTGRA